MNANIIHLALIMVVLSACGKDNMTTTLKGRLSDLRDQSISLVEIDAYFPGLVGDEKVLSTKTDSAGNFIFESTDIKSGYYQLVANDYHRLKYDLYLNVGDSIHIEQSRWNEPETFEITGKGSDKLNYLMNDYKVFPANKAFYDEINSNKFQTARSFKHFIDSICHLRLAVLHSDKGLSKMLKSHFEKVIQAESSELLLKHLERRNYNLNEEFSYHYPDSSYFDFLDTLKFDDLFCQSSSAKSFARRFLEYKARMALKDADDERWFSTNCSWRFEYVLKLENSLWKDLLALSTFQEFSLEMMRDTFFDELLAFNEGMTNSFYNVQDSIIYKRNINGYLLLSNGNPAPDFSLPDVNGDTVRVSEFIGNVVYIDFWGTWCYPCIEEIPGAIKLQSEYLDEPVIFLYIALEYGDDEIAYWRNFIQGKESRFREFLPNGTFPGIHLVAEKQFHNPEIEPYMINYAPTYLLIDHNGKIVNARASHPGDIRGQLDILIKAAKKE